MLRPTGTLMSRSVAVLLVLLLTLFGWTQNSEGTIETQVFPRAIVANGSSVATISVTVRDKNGQLAPDGTAVIFETTLGTLSRASVTTNRGLAQVQLTSSLNPGTARITLSVLSFRATTTLEIPILGSEEELKQRDESIQVFSDRRVTYSPELRLFEASGPDGAAKLRGYGVQVSADDFQYDLRSSQLKARKATLKKGEFEATFEEVSINLKSLQGVGLMNRPAPRISFVGKPPYFEVNYTQEVRRQLVDINGLDNIKLRREPVGPESFQFLELDVPTLIYAEKAIANPATEVRFNQASIDVAGTIIMRVPLFRVSTQNVQQIITEDYLQVGNNQVALNYPYYLGLNGSSESLLRFRYGTLFQRGVGGTGGMFLDFEHNWLTNSDAEGGIAVRGLGRNDWSIQSRQRLKLDSRSKGFMQLDFPGHRVLTGSTFLDRDLGALRASFSGNFSRSTEGPKFRTEDQSVSLLTDQKRIGSLPVSVSLGTTYSKRSSSFESSSGTNRNFAENYSAALNFTGQPISRRNFSLSSSARLSKQFGRRAHQSPIFNANLSGGMSVGPESFLGFGYDFTNDPFDSGFLGRHRVNANLSLRSGAIVLYANGTSSLDIDRYNIQLDATYRLSGLWRVGTSLTLDQFSGSRYQDTSVVVAYQLGMRQVGLSWSDRTKRIGLELLGVPLD